MGLTETTANQYISFDHPFNSIWIVGLIMASALLMLWTLTRERKILGAKLASFFGLLRLVALGTVLWMLLGPTSVVEETTSTKKAIAILTDVSASMTVVDPAGSSDDVRWATAEISDDDSLSNQLQLADRAVAALGLARSELSKASQQLEKYGSQNVVTESIVLADRSIQRSRSHLERLRNEAESEESSDLYPRLNGLLESPEFDSLTELATILKKERTPDQSDWREGLPDLIARTETSKRVFEELADQLLLQVSGNAQANAVTFRSKPRSERVAAFLDRLGESTLDTIAAEADVRWCAFGSSSEDVLNGEAAVRTLTTLADREKEVAMGQSSSETNTQQSKQTNLSAALEHVERMSREQPVAFTLVLSDVAHNQPGERTPTDIAATLDGSPVYVVPIGNQSRLRDVDLVSVGAPAVAMRNDNVVIEADLQIHQCAGETCVVQLLSAGEVLDFRNVVVDRDTVSHHVHFDQRVSNVGSASFQVAVLPLDGELTNENNEKEIEINVTRSDIKVLLADEMPRWETRYLAQLFRRDPKVELDELLFHPRVIATGRREETRTLPITADEWNMYDVVILGDLSPRHFSTAAQESLAEYLRKFGGTAILIAGSEAMPHGYVDHPLAGVLPVRPTKSENHPIAFSFQVTEAGNSHIALMIGETKAATRDSWNFVNQFSPLYSVSRWRSPIETAQSLIAVVPRETPSNSQESGPDSFLCWHSIGRGRLVYFSAPDTYRLRFLRGDQLHYRFWGQLMRWAIAADLATGNQLVRVRTTKTTYSTDEPVSIVVQLANTDGDPFAVDSNDTEILQLSLVAGDSEQMVPLVADEERPGHYVANLRSLPPDEYHAKPVGTAIASLVAQEDSSVDTTDGQPVSSVSFAVRSDLPTELIDTRCNQVLAGQVSELTGGQVLPPTAVAEILKLTDLDPIVTHHVQRRPLWLRWKYLWLVFACLQSEWIVRKWRGLS